MSDSESSSMSVSDESNKDVCKDFDPISFFESQKQIQIFKVIHHYFRKKCSKEMLDKMAKIISGKGETKISLRILEWVVTKSNKYSLNIKLEDGDNDNNRFINIMYKSQLKSYKKKNFDPFRRDKKFEYHYDKDDNTKTVVTTLGQLNFFKWAIDSKIINCVEHNYDMINDAMIKYNKGEKTKKKKRKAKVLAIKKASKESSSYCSDFSDKGKFSISFDE